MSSMFALDGKRAVVTGGATGIGFAMARALAQHGATVEIWGRGRDRLGAAVTSSGGILTSRQVDVTDEQQVVEGFGRAADSMGGLDVAIVNAGRGSVPVPFLDSTTDEYRAVMAANLDGGYWTIREAARAMAASGAGGSIISISSLAAVEGAARNQAYGATKAGLLAMSNGTAVELARFGIRVNTVLPGWIDTEMTENAFASTAFAAHVLPRVPAGRWGRPDDFAGIAVYLASDASRYQTGSSIVVDGGYSVF